jgi:hypothetical protein
MSSEVNVEFPACGKSKNLSSAKNLTGLQDLSGFGIARTPSTHTIAILPEALKGFEQGTIIGAYDQNGNCFGVTFYNSETISLTVFGDDPTTAEKDGFFEGEMILFETLSVRTGLTPAFDQNLPQSDGTFTKNGLSAIAEFKAATGVSGHNFGMAVNIFPNPTTGKVNISGLRAGADISINDLHGQTVDTFTAQSEQMTFDLSALPPGVYLVKIESGGQSIFRKLILQ